MRYLVCPDSFKGTMSAREVANAIGVGLAAEGAEADLCPAADGGEGTAATIATALGGTTCRAPAHDPAGNPIEAEFVLVGDGSTAVVDTAAASGLTLVPAADRDAEAASSYGTGELIAAAVGTGARRVVLAAGGSATTDGGLGAIEALRERGGPGSASLEILCDVVTTFEDAARVFGRQKGADDATIVSLTARLARIATELPRDPRGLPRGGAAGGLSGGLWAAFDAHLRPGADYVLGMLDFGRRLREADAAIGGEGRIDSQSLEGKIVGQIALACADAGRDLDLLVGRDEIDRATLGRLPIRSIREAGTEAALQRAAREIARRDSDKRC